MNEGPSQILIVGGNEAACVELAARVAEHGFTPAIVHDPTQVLIIVQEHPPALVVLIFDLPNDGSVRLAEQLKDNATLSTVPVLAVATVEQFWAVQRCLALGVDDYLFLPLQPQVLKARLDSLRAQQHLSELTSELAADAHREEALLKLERDVQIGRRIQASFLPTTLPEVPNWELAALFQPAREVAGDFYDAFPLNQGRRLGIVIADVCDKGVGAALFMALFRSLIRAFAQQHYSLRWMGDAETDFLTSPVADRSRGVPSTGTTALKNAMSLTNNYIITNHGDTSMFATMFFGVLDPGAGVLSYINGGHNPPWLYNASGIKARLTPTGPAVGMLPDADYKIQQVTFVPGDMLLLFTDGVPEARDPEGAFFTEARLRTLISDPMPSSGQELLARIHSQLTAHISTAAQFDDITMLAVRRLADLEPTQTP